MFGEEGLEEMIEEGLIVSRASPMNPKRLQYQAWQEKGFVEVKEPSEKASGKRSIQEVTSESVLTGTAYAAKRQRILTPRASEESLGPDAMQVMLEVSWRSINQI